MTTSFPRIIFRLLILFAVIIPGSSVFAQGRGGSSDRAIQSEVEKTDLRVTQVIARAEAYFKEGELHLKANERDQAREKFDKAVDTILDSGIDVRGSLKLRGYYVELVERVYRIEVPTNQNPSTYIAQNVQTSTSGPVVQTPVEQQQQVGFRDQRFEPSSLDILAKLILTEEEKKVTEQDVAALEDAKNRINFKFSSNPLIQGFINYYQGRGRATMESGLRRSGRFMEMARKIFREEGVPEDITWLGQVESAWQIRAVSHAAAAGLWQFIPGTGRAYQLNQTAWVDERFSYEKATRASARYLRWLSDRYHGDWELAMAAYNTGEGNIDGAIRRAGSSNFWDIYPLIHSETKSYVPNILAVILIAKNPEKYGFAGIKPEPPLRWAKVQVPTSTSLQLVADATDTSLDVLRALNPELKRDMTPRGEAYEVRIPVGKEKQLVASLKRIPGDRRDSARMIAVAPGEDLATVAGRTGISLQSLVAMNAGIDQKNPGPKVAVPTNMVREAKMVRAKTDAAAPSGTTLTRFKASAGDTISKIAGRLGVSAVELARLNGIAVDAPLKAGQELRVPSTSSQPSRRRS